MSGIKKTSGVNVKQILANTAMQAAVGCIVGQDSATTVGSRKIVLAGTPVSGDLTNRKTKFVKHVDTTANAVGVVLHDVDVTDGDENASLLIFGFVNLNRMDTQAQALITTGVKTALDGKIWFIKD